MRPDVGVQVEELQQRPRPRLPAANDEHVGQPAMRVFVADAVYGVFVSFARQQLKLGFGTAAQRVT